MQLSFPWRRSALLAAVAAIVLPLAAPLAARADGDDQSGVGVARISVIDGSVAVQRGDTSAPIDAAVNAPVLAADYVTTGDASRAEVQFDAVSALRLGDNVQMRFTRLDPGNRQFQVAQGTVELSLLQGADGENDIDTPSVSIRPLDTGSYRVTVDPDGHTLLTVRSGRAEVVMPQGNQVVSAGSALLAQGPASSPSVQTAEAVAMDDFDNFNRGLDEHEMPALAQAPVVGENVQGVADLDANGRWVHDDNYDQVWVPSNVGADWAPYRDGRWVWEDYYGWTWVGAEPWGWAPYHYGRWYHSASYGWAWYPGPRAVFSPWQPALVAFVGFGGGGLSLGFGNIGWVPLAPFEAFHPWWGRGLNNTPVAANFGGTHVYRNTLYNGATFVNHERFLQGRFDHPSVMTAEQFRSGEVVRGAVPVVPTRENLRFTDRSAPANLAVRSAFTQRSFAGNAGAVQRTPFEQQRTAVAGGARPGSFEPNRGSTPTNYTPSGRGSNNAWSRFGATRSTYSADPQGRRTDTYQRPTYNEPSQTYQRSTSTYRQPESTYRQPESTYRQPTSTYRQPESTYRQPAYSQPGSTYRQPESTYRQPSYNQSSGYRQPSYNQSSGYRQPSYNQSSGYRQPSYNQSSGYRQPSYNQSSTYRQPSYTRSAQTYQRQPSYSPARTQQGSRSASTRQTSNGHDRR
jgi:hypothetical protein